MPPREGNDPKREVLGKPSEVSDTVTIFQPNGGPPYVQDDSSGAFQSPFVDTDGHKTAAQVNDSLNLHLGQTLIDPSNEKLLRMLKFCSTFLLSWYESYLFCFWNALPLSFKTLMARTSWKVLFPLHKYCIGKRTGLHPSQSYEYCCFTTLVWAGRLFPITIPRMRFMLEQLSVGRPYMPSTVERVKQTLSIHEPPECQKDHTTVSGWYIHNHSSLEPTQSTILWFFGGAFLAGDPRANLGPAGSLGKSSQMDVFIPNVRRAPEANIYDILWDVLLVYRYLYELRRSRNQDPTQIYLWGCSSGAALCVRLLQHFVEYKAGDTLSPPYLSVLLKDLQAPKGAILASPYCSFRQQPKAGSFLNYSQHDLIVHQAVQDLGLPFLDSHMCGEKLTQTPVARRLSGLPNICVLLSEHETVYDMAIELVNALRANGVSVRVGLWQYCCHVWLHLDSFLPEGRQAMEFMTRWLLEQQQQDLHRGKQ